VLKRIQFFDPVGVAARDLRECLLVQLENLKLKDSLAARIADGWPWPAFTHHSPDAASSTWRPSGVQ
jgi:DNA-directed RNA polymerase specialized sigma54-like protein